jgi:hypothetical protein
MNNRKNTFWSLLQRGKIVIPQIQRDYAYGRETEKAVSVRHGLLNAMLRSVESNDYDPEKALVLDFVYGSIQKDNSMTPIDGQQRLTTLFLLHLYAAIKESRLEKTELLKFSYETRHSANEFCKSLIKDFKYDLASGISLIKQIKNESKYLNSYDDDPTIQSMLIVLDEIHKMFWNVSRIWDKLTNEKAIIFYYLDLDKFGLTDDLYIKMNSRGKSLTRYEIFKSAFEKYLEEKHPLFKDEISKKLDVEWTNMLWEEKCEIDSGFLNLFKNIFIINYYRNSSLPRPIDDADKSFEEMLPTMEDISFFKNFLDAFQSLYIEGRKSIEDYYERFFYSSDEAVGISELIRVFWQSKENLFVKATKSTLTWAETIMFYALLISLQNKIDQKHLFFRFRQLRNLLANSSFELRPVNIHKMLLYTNHLVLKGILPDDTFNQNQLLEEKSDYKVSDTDNELLVYENHDILRGSLGLFLNSSKGNHVPTLNKFISIFDNNYKQNTSLIRNALLAKDDYSQQDSDPHKRFLLHKDDAWSSFFTINQRRKEQEKVIAIIDSIGIGDNLEQSLQQIVSDYISSGIKDWRYYFIKYDDQLHDTTTQGYYYWKNRLACPLEVIILNSSYESSSNLEWNIFNWILYDKNRDSATLDDHGASDLVLFKASLTLNGIEKGFEVKATTEQNTVLEQLIEENIIYDGLFFVKKDEDFIEKGQQLIIKIKALCNTPPLLVLSTTGSSTT